MAKYVQPTFDVYGVAKFINQVTFDTSILLQSPVTSSIDNPNALVIDSTGANQVLKIRTLGTMAWEAASDLEDVSTRLNTAEGDITQIGTDITDVSTRVQTIESDYLDSVDDVGGTAGTGLYAYEDANTAYIKTIVGGTGASVTSDASTVTISVTSAEGYSEKWSGTFNSDGSTSFVFDPSSISGTGPYGVTVWEDGEIVQTSVSNSGGTITLSWIPLSLVGICDVLVIG